MRLEEALQRKSALLWRSQRLQFRLVDDDVLLRGVGEAGDDGAGLDLAVQGTMFFVADAVAAAGMELVEVDLVAGAGGGVGFDRDSDET